MYNVNDLVIVLNGKAKGQIRRVKYNYKGELISLEGIDDYIYSNNDIIGLCEALECDLRGDNHIGYILGIGEKRHIIERQVRRGG